MCVYECMQRGVYTYREFMCIMYACIKIYASTFINSIHYMVVIGSYQIFSEPLQTTESVVPQVPYLKWHRYFHRSCMHPSIYCKSSPNHLQCCTQCKQCLCFIVQGTITKSLCMSSKGVNFKTLFHLQFIAFADTEAVDVRGQLSVCVKRVSSEVGTGERAQT